MKKRLKKLILWFSALIARNRSGKIIFYHDVFDKVRHTKMGTPLGMFRRHVSLARALGYTFVDEPPKRSGELMLCLDDGFRGIWDTRGYFIAEKLHPTVFVAIELIGSPGYLTLEEIRQLMAFGFRFQSHGWSHMSLTECADDVQLRKEIVSSKIELERLIGMPVTGLCFPRGLFSARVLEIARQAGYADLYSSLPGDVEHMPFPGVLPRLLCQYLDEGEFASVLHGGMNLFSKRYIHRHFKLDRQ